MCKVAPVYYFIFKHKLPPTETLVERECCFYAAADLRRRRQKLRGRRWCQDVCTLLCCCYPLKCLRYLAGFCWRYRECWRLWLIHTGLVRDICFKRGLRGSHVSWRECRWWRLLFKISRTVEKLSIWWQNTVRKFQNTPHKDRPSPDSKLLANVWTTLCKSTLHNPPNGAKHVS